MTEPKDRGIAEQPLSWLWLLITTEAHVRTSQTDPLSDQAQ